VFARHITGVVAAGAGRHVVRAAYAAAQNDIYLLAGLAAVACGLVAMALIRPDRTPARPPAAEPAVPVMSSIPTGKVE
jgi:hypothetical protein